jgi:hypothetical protein
LAKEEPPSAKGNTRSGSCLGREEAAVVAAVAAVAATSSRASSRVRDLLVPEVDGRWQPALFLRQEEG